MADSGSARSNEKRERAERAITYAALAARNWPRLDGEGANEERAKEMLGHLSRAAAELKYLNAATGHGSVPAPADLVAEFEAPVRAWLPNGPEWPLVEQGALSPEAEEYVHNAGPCPMAGVFVSRTCQWALAE